MDATAPDIQLIANLVIRDPAGRILLVRYNAAEERWWLPGDDLEPYQHPGERAGSSSRSCRGWSSSNR